MRSTSPENSTERCRGRRPGTVAAGAAILAFALALCVAEAAGPQPAAEAACAAARDRDLRALAVEAIAIAGALDTDAAIADAPEYELSETKKAVLADIERARLAVWDRYRRCLAGP